MQKKLSYFLITLLLYSQSYITCMHSKQQKKVTKENSSILLGKKPSEGSSICCAKDKSSENRKSFFSLQNKSCKEICKKLCLLTLIAGGMKIAGLSVLIYLNVKY